jgi:hypothetical protein
MRHPPAPWLLTKKANAALIAAAPELLAILHNLIFNEDQKSCGVSLGSLSMAARAALAKAVQS